MEISRTDHLSIRATAARYLPASRRVKVTLSNGVELIFPADIAQGLVGASDSDLRIIEITPLGLGLHWPKLDADLLVEGLFAGFLGSRQWMRDHLAKAGSVKSAKKAAASRLNGSKGGRPPKLTSRR